MTRRHYDNVTINFGHELTEEEVKTLKDTTAMEKLIQHDDTSFALRDNPFNDVKIGDKTCSFTIEGVYANHHSFLKAMFEVIPMQSLVDYSCSDYTINIAGYLKCEKGMPCIECNEDWQIMKSDDEKYYNVCCNDYIALTLVHTQGGRVLVEGNHAHDKIIDNLRVSLWDDFLLDDMEDEPEDTKNTPKTAPFPDEDIPF